jgi:tetratricopeptide (TPR) repeat protein
MDKMVVRSTTPVLNGGLEAMNRETDLELAKAALPANLKFVEGLIDVDPENETFRNYAAQGFYAYAFGFVEDESPERASALYERCFRHALAGLKALGLTVEPTRVPQEELEQALAGLGAEAVPNLFWAGSCWGKWIDMNRDDPARLVDLGRAAALIQRVLGLDEGYYYGGSHLFFGIYYSSRPPILGGDYQKAREHFDRAHTLSQGKILLVDVLRAQYLDRQTQDRAAFHQRLSRVLEASVDAYPAAALNNRISQSKAELLLAKEDAWF